MKKDKTISVKKQGKYIRVYKNGTEKAVYSKITKKMWGDTQYFKYLKRR